MSFASHSLPSSLVRVASNCESIDGPSAAARFCEASLVATGAASLPAGRPFIFAIERSMELRRDWISFWERTAGVYCAELSLLALSHWLRYAPLAIWLSVSSPLIQRRRSSTLWDALSVT